MPAVADQVLERLQAVVGPGGSISDPADIRPFVSEPRDKYHGSSKLVLKPASTAEVQAIVAICAETGTPIVPQGGNTSLVGGAIPFDSGAEVILNLSRMNRVRALDAANNTITVEAGCVLQAVQEAAAAADRLFPLRIASEGSCQIGGNISSNAGGTAVLHYGNTRDLVLGLEVVLPDGTLWDGLRGLRKDNTGYDLKQLFIGAEGTLGIITAAVLKLFPKPAEVETALVAVRDPEAALELLGLAGKLSAGQVTAFELMPRIGLEFVLRHMPMARRPFAELPEWSVLVELSGGGGIRGVLEQILAGGIEAGWVDDALIANSGEQAQAFWYLREAMSDAQRPEGGSIKCDVAVPVSQTPAFLRQALAAVTAACPGVRPCPFGHLGDGNIHFNLSQPVGADKAAFLARWDELSTLVHDIVAAFNGSISAEHGLGRMKRDEITHYKSAVEIALMRRIKTALDPANLLNPGKVVAL